MKLETPTFVSVEDLVGRINSALGQEFPHTFYGNLVGKSSVISSVAVGERGLSGKIETRYVITIANPHHQQRNHAPAGVYNIMGSDFEVMGNQITLQLIQSIKRSYELTSARGEVQQLPV